ncbi:NADP-dependent oxidoreductase domain-containing protein [Naematelia encephala]|uniref:NADP-dependent oxidoreductase domain-containing protein n=1 Tax=Naematelia encephala TaxID=71784 RepID=A0A1Y2ASI1_9TREE|nr:NADP-dependent oxidoreductase domain-containing protein [Naematelia encephala]
MVFSPTITLNDKSTIPAIGYGIGTTHFKSECTEHVVSALKTGYRYLDCAQQYTNSASVGDALKQWDGKREDLFILTKFGITGQTVDPREVLDEELKKLGVDYVDLFLVHNPFYAEPNGLVGTWKILESLVESGKTRSIGVSNFREEDLLEMESEWKIPPAVNQIEYHPYVAHIPAYKRLLALCAKHNIIIQCYGPSTPIIRAPGGPVDHVIEDIASEEGSTVGQVLLQWAHQVTGGVVVTTSRQPARQKEQLEAITKLPPLSAAQLDAISEAGKLKTFRHFQPAVWNAAKP